jgi:hypothetical protein
MGYRTLTILMRVRVTILFYYFFLWLLMLRTARLFHELRQGYELLLDPLRRMALDAKLRLASAKKERYKAYDSKRKAMVADLEEREAAFKRTRAEKDREERARWTDNERIKEEGRKMREDRQKRMQDAEEAKNPDTPTGELADDEPPELGLWFALYNNGNSTHMCIRLIGHDCTAQIFSQSISGFDYGRRNHSTAHLFRRC